MKITVFLLASTFLYVSGGDYQDIKNHPCKRKCDGTTMICEYELVLENYFTMQPDCEDCATGVYDDCFNEFCIPADGRSRVTTVFNGQLPGPGIEVCKGDTLKVKFVNLVEEKESTIHWHGMHQFGTQDMDGVPMLTQCPVCSRNNFTYTFIAAQPGTHFYHSHTGAQRADGAFGPLIVRDQDSAIKHRKLYDEDLSEHTMALIDWFPGRADDYRIRYIKTKNFYFDQEVTLLINGMGRSKDNAGIPPIRFHVKQGLRYRFRTIQAGNIVCPIQIQAANHKLTAIASDGNDFNPTTVDILTITNGERYDFIIEANQPVGKYYMSFKGTVICDNLAHAVLVYEGAENATDIVEVSQDDSNKRILNCHGDTSIANCLHYQNLEGYDNPLVTQIKSTPALTYFLGFDQYLYSRDKNEGVGQGELFSPLINLIHYESATKPLLHVPDQETCRYETVRDGNKTCYGCTHVVWIDNDAVIELVLYDIGQYVDLVHPIHFHGHNMAVLSQVKIGSPLSTEHMTALHQNNTLLRDFDKPILKDTVSVPYGGYAIVRFVSNNPGCWLCHCHVDFHSEDGMQMAFCTRNLPSFEKNLDNKCY